MNTPLNNDTQQKARDLARKITVAHDLDPEIQEELYGHIEDKLLAYKSGEERVSDADAFILVREHFGDAKVIRGLLRGVHREAVQVSLLRQILTLVIATSAFYIASAFTGGIVQICVALLIGDGGAPSRALYQSLIQYSSLPVIGGILFVYLFRWKRLLRLGKLPWFTEWPLSKLVGIAIALTAVKWATPAISFAYSTATFPYRYEPILLTILSLGPVFCMCTAWLWWGDSARRGLRRLFGVSMIWLLYSLSALLIPFRLMIVLGSSDYSNGPFTKLASLQWSGVEFTCYAFNNWSFGYSIVASLSLCTAIAILCTLSYYLGYRVWQRWVHTDFAVSARP
jgi:hypothetical protein